MDPEPDEKIVIYESKKIYTLSLSILMILLVSFSAFAHEDHKHEPHRYLKYARMKSPVAMTAESIAEGGKLYAKHCMACHGEEGKGGSAPDLTAPVLTHGTSDGEIFHVITDGVARTAMKGFKKDITQEMRWHLVNYIKSLHKKTKG